MTTQTNPRPLHPAIEAVLAAAATVGLVIFAIVLIMIVAGGSRAGAAEFDRAARCADGAVLQPER